MRVSVSLDFSLILSWSSEEAGRYLETFKVYENKPADLITEKTGNTPFEIVKIVKINSLLNYFIVSRFSYSDKICQ
jgi:uncharacterized protein (UPF0333 family)